MLCRKYVNFFKNEPVFLVGAVMEEDYYYIIINKNLELLFESCLGAKQISKWQYDKETWKE